MLGLFEIALFRTDGRCNCLWETTAQGPINSLIITETQNNAFKYVLFLDCPILWKS